MSNAGNVKTIVIGSLNTDLVAVGLRKFPKPGEHVYGKELRIGAGGKSRNIADMIAHLTPNNVCDIFAYYIARDADKQIVMNIGVDAPTTFYDFMIDVAKELDIDPELLQPDGNEAGWPQNSSLSMQKLHKLGYPSISYEQTLQEIKEDAQ